MLKVFGVMFTALSMTLLMVSGVVAQTEPDVMIYGVWGRATAVVADSTDDAGDDMAGMSMGGTSAVYMTIENLTDTDLILMSVETDAAAVVEIHETAMGENDVMTMRPLLDGLAIPAGEAVELRPGGYHVMLLEPIALAPGDAFNLDLTFADATGNDEPFTVRVGVPVMDMMMVMDDTPPVQVNAVSAWVRPTVAADADEEGIVAGTSAVYMVMTNTGETDDRLVSVTTDAAAVIEIHETAMGENDVMTMRPLLEGLAVPAGESVELRPGGYHVMLLEPIALAPGDAMSLTLVFESGNTLTIAAPVEDRMMMGMQMAD